jgi:hypothetical protein
MTAHDRLRSDTRAALRPGLIAPGALIVAWVIARSAGVFSHSHGVDPADAGRVALLAVIAVAVVTAVRLQRLRCPTCVPAWQARCL